MSTYAVVLLFAVMIAAPCAIAVRSSRKYNEDGTDPLEIDAPELEPEPMEPPVILAGADLVPRVVKPRRATALQEMAHEAEAEARVAHDRAEQAHWAALIAQARAAAIRADAAAEIAARASRTAEKALIGTEFGYLPADHPSLDFPRSRTTRRTAA